MECVQCHVTGYGQPTGYELTLNANASKQTAETVDTPPCATFSARAATGWGPFTAPQP